MKTITCDYDDGSTKCRGYLAYTKQNAPLVLVAHAWKGQDDFARMQAEKLAEKGYAGFAIDMYGDGVCVENDQAASMMAPFFLDRHLLRKRIQAALDFGSSLREVDSKRCGAIGFCFGGLCVYELLCSGAKIDAAISFHGVFADEFDSHHAKLAPIAAGVKGQLLLLHGDLDPMVSQEDLARLRRNLTEKEVDWQLHIFGGAMHAFTNPMAQNPEAGTVYHPSACQRAFELADAHFAASLLERD